jgi:4-hydroxythreonine-4-phosphate dehydrogenase
LRRIAITMGDPAGIGGELILKALDQLARFSIPVVIGDLSVLERLWSRLFLGRVPPFRPFHEGSPGFAEMVEASSLEDVRFGESDASCGRASYEYVLEALRLLFSGEVAAVVTCPINKRSIQAAGAPFIGHTELLAHFGGAADYVMMMAAGTFRVSLATIHVPLKDVPGLITSERVFKTIAVTARSLEGDFGIRGPRIKVCGVNPHAGEEGMMGNEEEAVREAIERARENSIRAEGPFPADSLFYKGDSDAYVAMYHDQGLIPVKTKAFARTVNITLGLPFVRTSVGHGTGLDIAGKGEADPSSLIEAYRVAESICAFRSGRAR